MKAKDFAVVVQYGSFISHIESYHDDRVDALRAAREVKVRVEKKKNARGPRKPTVMVWGWLDTV